MKYIVTIFLLFSLFNLNGQIIIANGDFEDEPASGAMPQGWFANNLGSTPDILPGFWNVTLPPSSGESYIGLISREDGTTESIGQKLEGKIIKGTCYHLSLDLAHSKTYSNYNLPLELKLWGSDDGVSKKQLLFRSEAIITESWKTYEPSFMAKSEFKYIIIEAVRVIGAVFYYKGNILIDNMTPITLCDKA